jgi:hypothetical protein
VHGVASGFQAIATELGRIPLVGPGLHGILIIETAPFLFADSVASGERIDRAAIANLAQQVTAVREVAPYAQTVLSLMPGVGQGVSAAIGASLALAQGRPIDEAVLAGMQAALPGGPAARAAFSLTVHAASGDNVLDSAGNIGVDALGLPPAAAAGLHTALNTVYRAAKGDNIPKAALEEARTFMPDKDTRDAFDVAIALANGKRLQDAAISELSNLSPEQRAALVATGTDLIQQTPVLQAADKTIGTTAQKFGHLGESLVSDPAAQNGYRLGVGLMRHAGVNEDTVRAVRGQLTSAAEQRGFDTGLAMYKGAVTTHVDASTDVGTAAGYLAARGMTGNPNPLDKTEAVKTFMIIPQQRAGVALAVKTAASRRLTFWSWLRGLLHV